MLLNLGDADRGPDAAYVFLAADRTALLALPTYIQQVSELK